MRRRLTTSLVSEADAVQWIEDQSEGWANGARLSFAVLQCGSDNDHVGRLVGHIVVKGGTDPTKASAERLQITVGLKVDFGSQQFSLDRYIYDHDSATGDPG